MVTDEQDYKAHFTDPDTLVNWDCVQQVVRALIEHLSFTWELWLRAVFCTSVISIFRKLHLNGGGTQSLV